MLDYALATAQGPWGPRWSDFGRALLDDEGLPVCVWGILPLRPAVAEAWAVVDRSAKRHRDQVFEMAALQLGVLERGMSLRRIQGAVREDFAPGLRFVERLGFEREGLMKNYGEAGQGNYYLYARTC
jgi:hypothetical protein